MTLMRWQRPDLGTWGAFDQLSTLRNEINRLFDVPFSDSNGPSEFFGWAPVVDVYEDKDRLVVKAELPGLKKEDIEISLHQGNLESTTEEGEVSRSERLFGRFQRSIELPKPVDADKVAANYKDGILTVTLGKTEESKPRQISVKAG